MNIHFQHIPLGGAYPSADPGWWKARYYRDGQKYAAVFPCPTDEAEAQAVGVELQRKANELGVVVQVLPGEDLGGCGGWAAITPQTVTRYAFVVRWPDGREPELATRDGHLVVSTDKTVLCPPYEAVVFAGDPRWTVGVTDQEESRAASTP